MQSYDFLNCNYMTLKNKTRCEQDPTPDQNELKNKTGKKNNAKRKKTDGRLRKRNK